MKVLLVFIRTLKLASAVKRLKGRMLHVDADQKRLYFTLPINSIEDSLKVILCFLGDNNSTDKHYRDPTF